MNYLNILKHTTFLIFGLLLIHICGCERVQNMITSEPHDAMETAPIQVSIVYPGDCLSDSSYCDVLYNGVQKATAELRVEITEMESNFETWDMQLRAGAENAGLVITSGYQMADSVSRVAPEFPDVMFVIFDAAVDLPNVVSFTHRVNEGTFLLGAIAGLKSKTGKVGYLGGANVPLLHEFEAGYLAGVKAVNPNAEIVRDYVAEDQQGFYNPAKGQELATAQYESGVDVIYTMADQSGFGAVEAAKMAEDRYVIWNYIDISDVAPSVILTGLRVGINESAYNVIQAFAAGNLMAGVHSLGLAEDNVGYILAEGNKDLLPDALLEKVEALKASIIAGEITVPMIPEMGIQGTVIPPTTSENNDAVVPAPNVEGTVIPPAGGAPDTQ